MMSDFMLKYLVNRLYALGWKKNMKEEESKKERYVCINVEKGCLSCTLILSLWGRGKIKNNYFGRDSSQYFFGALGRFSFSFSAVSVS